MQRKRSEAGFAIEGHDQESAKVKVALKPLVEKLQALGNLQLAENIVLGRSPEQDQLDSILKALASSLPSEPEETS